MMKYPKFPFDDSSDDGYSKMNPQDDLSKNEHTTFENNWKNALFNSEINPPDEIWNELENKLPVFENKNSKNRTKVYLFFMYGAAMTLFFVITFIAGFYHGKLDSNDFASPNISEKNSLNISKPERLNPSQSIVDESYKKETNSSKFNKNSITPTETVLNFQRNKNSASSEPNLSLYHAQSNNFNVDKNNLLLNQKQLDVSANVPPQFAVKERTVFLKDKYFITNDETSVFENSLPLGETNYTSLFKNPKFNKPKIFDKQINFAGELLDNSVEYSLLDKSHLNNQTDEFSRDKQDTDTLSDQVYKKPESNLALNSASESKIFKNSVSTEQPLSNDYQAQEGKKTKWILASTFNTITLNDNIQYNQTVAQPNYTMEKRTSSSGVSESRYMENEAKVPVETQWTPLMSYSGSVEVGYRINSHFSVQSGIQYSFQQTHRKGDFMLADSMGKLIMLPNNIPYDQTQSYELKNQSFSVTQSLQYIGLPIKAIFKTGKRSTKFITSAGLLANLLIKSSELSADNNKEGATLTSKQAREPSMYSPIYLSTFLGTGIEWAFAQKYALQIEPNVRFSLTSLTKPEIAFSYPFSVGLSLTLLMNLQ